MTREICSAWVLVLIFSSCNIIALSASTLLELPAHSPDAQVVQAPMAFIFSTLEVAKGCKLIRVRPALPFLVMISSSSSILWTLRVSLPMVVKCTLCLLATHYTCPLRISSQAKALVWFSTLILTIYVKSKWSFFWKCYFEPTRITARIRVSITKSRKTNKIY